MSFDVQVTTSSFGTQPVSFNYMPPPTILDMGYSFATLNASSGWVYSLTGNYSTANGGTYTPAWAVTSVNVPLRLFL